MNRDFVVVIIVIEVRTLTLFLSLVLVQSVTSVWLLSTSIWRGLSDLGSESCKGEKWY